MHSHFLHKISDLIHHHDGPIAALEHSWTWLTKKRDFINYLESKSADEYIQFYLAYKYFLEAKPSNKQESIDELHLKNFVNLFNKFFGENAELPINLERPKGINILKPIYDKAIAKNADTKFTSEDFAALKKVVENALELCFQNFPLKEIEHEVANNKNKNRAENNNDEKPKNVILL